MARSLSSFLNPLYLLAFFKIAGAEIVTYDWNLTWVSTNPDKAFDRTTIGINNQWPLPLVNVTKGDNLIVNVHNMLGNESSSIHFHGMYQEGTTEMDGVVGVTQCAIPPGSSFTYNFTVNQIGTYWYHSHVRGQYPDGLRGPMLINDPESPYLGQYDEEVVLTLSDWYHDEMPGLIKQFINVLNPTGAEPIPDGALMNDSQNITLSMQAGKTYLFHIVNMGAFAGQYFWFEGHSMRVVETDGIWSEPATTDMLYISVAQRYSVLITARNDTDNNYAIVGAMDTDLFDTVPDSLQTNVTGWLRYNDDALPTPQLIDEYDPFDDFVLIPYDHQPLFDTVDQQLTINMKMDNLGDGANYAFVNDVTYVSPKVPTLYSLLSTGPSASNPAIYGVNTNVFMLAYNETIEIVLNNMDAGKHPWHLHGHDFQVVARSADDAGDFAGFGNTSLPAIPMRRDTLLVHPNGHFAIRFRSNNPGVWLFHCHLEWHVDSGLIATIVEAPLELQKTLVLPDNHLRVCQEADTPTVGNAAANTENYLDLKGAHVSPKPLPAGFTPGGIVALVFSVVSAFVGLASIIIYGMAPISANELAAVKKRIGETGDTTSVMS